MEIVLVTILSVLILLGWFTIYNLLVCLDQKTTSDRNQYAKWFDISADEVALLAEEVRRLNRKLEKSNTVELPFSDLVVLEMKIKTKKGEETNG